VLFLVGRLGSSEWNVLATQRQLEPGQRVFPVFIKVLTIREMQLSVLRPYMTTLRALVRFFVAADELQIEDVIVHVSILPSGCVRLPLAASQDVTFDKTAVRRFHVCRFKLRAAE
jgi:hypothetical protein